MVSPNIKLVATCLTYTHTLIYIQPHTHHRIRMGHSACCGCGVTCACGWFTHVYCDGDEHAAASPVIRTGLIKRNWRVSGTASRRVSPVGRRLCRRLTLILARQRVRACELYQTKILRRTSTHFSSGTN